MRKQKIRSKVNSTRSLYTAHFYNEWPKKKHISLMSSEFQTRNVEYALKSRAALRNIKSYKGRKPI